ERRAAGTPGQTRSGPFRNRFTPITAREVTNDEGHFSSFSGRSAPHRERGRRGGASATFHHRRELSGEQSFPRERGRRIAGRGTYDGDGSGDGIPAEGAGTRLMWYPRKGALRAGGVSGTQWDAANIGDYSVAIGQDVRASASYATAFGLRATAAQVSSFAAGEDNTASGASSVALGYHAHTNARSGSFVFGDRSTTDTIRAGVNHSANWRVAGGFRIFTSSNL